MTSDDAASTGRAFAGLRRLKRVNLPEERCDSCATGLSAIHQHMVDCSNHRLLCICSICSMMLGSESATRFRSVPSAGRSAAELQISDAQWDALRIPVALAFIYTTGQAGQAYVVYPSPGGPIASELDSMEWPRLVDSNPILQSLRPYVEALLINRVNNVREYLVAPIDECYRLVGIVRREWRGFGGGMELQEEMAAQLQELRRRAGGPV